MTKIRKYFSILFSPTFVESTFGVIISKFLTSLLRYTTSCSTSRIHSFVYYIFMWWYLVLWIPVWTKAMVF